MRFRRATLASLVLAACSATAAEARKPRCEPPEVDHYVALIEAANGDMALILATVQQRMSSPQLECWANASGDKRLLLELGTRYESGDGVPRDMARAELLYASAAAFRNGTTYIYVPGIKGRGTVMPLRTGPDVPGLPEGNYRLGLLHIEGRATKPNYRRGLCYLERAAKGGFAPAADRLRALQANRS